MLRRVATAGRLARQFSTETLVMAATGADREGLLPKVASAVQAAGGNMRENKVSRLGGLFAAVMRIETPGHQADAAIKKALADLGLAVTAERKDPPTRVGDLRKVNVRPLDSDKAPNPSKLVADVTAYLCAQGLVVEELTTSLERGTPEISGLLRVPHGFAQTTAQVVRGLNGIGAHALYLDLEFGP